MPIAESGSKLQPGWRERFHVILACRSEEKGQAARRRLIERVPLASCEVLTIDLSDFDSVRRFVASFEEQHDTIDVLVNNAGILLYSNQVNKDGIELQFATNHVGHFLLTALLIDRMPDRPESRVVSLSSIAHKGATIDFTDLQRDGMEVAYGQSKLACLLFSDALSRRLQQSGRSIKSICVHPGGTESELFRDADQQYVDALKSEVSHLLHSNESAAQSSLFAALSDDAETGEYYGPTGPGELSGEVGIAHREISGDPEAISETLWRLSEQLTGQPFEF